MKLSVRLAKTEKLTNFSFAEVIWEFCKENANDLDADTVAKMILVQGESEDTECETQNSIGF